MPLAVDAESVAWIVTTRCAPTASAVALLQVTVCPIAEQPASEPLVWNRRPAGSASMMLKPPVFADGPLLVIVSV